MSVVRGILENFEIPEFYHMRNTFDDSHVDDVAEAVRAALRRPGTLDRIEPGKSVCFTASSREIANSVVILRTLAEEFYRVGARPVVVPGMGSHGGATAEGQLAVLTHYGITEETIGCPIHSCMDTEKIGVSADGFDVRMDAFALSCDYVVPVGRIKAHTDFHGPFESGIMKMLAIGLGKQYGAEICHQMGMDAMTVNVPSFGRVALKSVNIPFAFGIVENALHQTHTLRAIPNEAIEAEEPVLLKLSKDLIPVVPFDKVDVLIVEQIGKEISGDGMDPNVIGRSRYAQEKPFIERLGVLNLSEMTGSNFNGLGMADATTRRVFDKISFEETYPNSITAIVPEYARIPMVLDSDRLCIQLCIKTSVHCDGEDGIRIVWIKDTLHAYDFYISEGLYRTARENPAFIVDGEPLCAVFDAKGDFTGFSPV